MGIADIVVHVHPELSAEDRALIEESVGGRNGVVAVHFFPGRPHTLAVAYNPQVIHSEEVLKQVRQWDREAMMAGL